MTTKSPLKSIQTPNLLQEQLARLKAEFPDLFTNEGQLNPAELLRLTGQQGREHFDFQWWGKSAAKRKAFAPTTAALRYDAARSVNPDKAGGNAIIEGENLEVLKLLLCAYRGQVKCIYIDPPYNTGNDFVYKDNFTEGQQAYWEQTGVTQEGVKMSTNTKSDGRFHSNWLNMIYPRLLVARQLLREDGVIFVSIDDNEVTHLRKVMDEVFGEENFFAFLTRRAMHTVRNTSKDFNKHSDYVLVYAFNKTWFEADPSRYIRVLRDKTDNYPFDDSDGRGVYKTDPLSARNYMKPYVYTFKNGVVWQAPEGSYPRYSKDTLAEMESDNRLVFTGKEPTAKRYLAEVQEGQPPNTILDPADVGFNSEGTSDLHDQLGADKVFSQPKPMRLVKFLASLLRDKNGLYLDFFAGSGTTAEAILRMNAEDQGERSFVAIQLPEAIQSDHQAAKVGHQKISDITIERVKRVIQGYGENPQPIAAGFKVFKLERTSFPRADFAPDPTADEAEQLAALKAFIADKEASLFNTLDAQSVRDEVLLKCGFQLDVQLTPIAEVKANKLYRAQDQQILPREAIVCFDNQLDTTTLEWLCLQKGRRVIVLEAALDTTGKWNLHHQLGDGLVVF